MEQKFVDEKVYTEHSKMCDERFRRDKDDIARISDEVDDIKKLTVEAELILEKYGEKAEFLNTLVNYLSSRNK